jgi:hypothetical protein
VISLNTKSQNDGTYLWREIEAQIAVVCETILDKQRHLVAQTELDLLAETTGLAEVD